MRKAAAAAAAAALLLLSTSFPGNEARGEVCFPHAAMDIFFLVEYSGSNVRQFTEIKQFLLHLVRSFHVTWHQVRVGLIRYSRDGQAGFTLSIFNETEEMNSAIENLQQLSSAVDAGHILEFLLSHQFTVSPGSRASEGMPQVAVVITDGASADKAADPAEVPESYGITARSIAAGASPKPKPTSRAKRAESADDVEYVAELLKRQGFTAYCAVDLQLEEVRLLDVAREKGYKYLLPSFAELQQRTEDIGQSLCEFAEDPTLQAYRVCPQWAKADIIFLVDGSYSMTPQDFVWVKKFLHVLVGLFYTDLDQVQFGLVQYSDKPQKEFQLNMEGLRHRAQLFTYIYHAKKNIQRYIWNFEKAGGTKTMTGLALDFLLSHQFDETAGSRMRQGVPQIAVLITGQRCSDAAQEKAEELKKRGIVLYAVGGRDATLEELREIASKPENVYFVSNFSGLHDITENITQSICARAEEDMLDAVHRLPDSNAFAADGHLTVQRGRSLTIQCHYDEQYRHHVKYWCRTRARSSCVTIVRSDTPETRGQVSISDDAARHVFHVTITDLQTMDSGVYWCGVETNDTEIYVASLNLTVTAGALSLLVDNNMLTGQTGDSVSVRCFYSEANKEQEKKWCRMGDRSSCLTADPNGTSRDRVQLDIDDRRRIFTVTLRTLERKDTGWYWIAAGDEHMPVHISVGTGNADTRSDRNQLFCFPLTLNLQTSDSQSSGPSTAEEAVHALLHVATVVLYVMCTALAASKAGNRGEKTNSRQTESD